MQSDIKNEKEQLLKQLYSDFFFKIYRYFYYKTLSKDKAEDLTSDTFLSLAEMVAKNKRMDDPKKYLFGIAKNVLNKYLRNKYNEREVFVPTEMEFCDILEKINSPADDNLDVLAFKYIPYLPDKQREVLRLRLIEKHNLKEICEIIGKDMNYVKTTQKRGIKSLRKIISCTPILT